MKKWTLAFLLLVAAADPARPGSREDDLLQAVRTGDAAAVRALLDQGVPVDTKFRYDRTALSFAADRGNVEIVRLLLDRGAERRRAGQLLQQHLARLGVLQGHAEVVKLLLAKTVTGAPGALLSGVLANKPDVVDAVLATGKVGARDLSYALQAAEKEGAHGHRGADAQGGRGAAAAADAAVDPAVLARYAGLYREEAERASSPSASPTERCRAVFPGGAAKLGAIDATHFQHPTANGMTLEMRLEGERVVGADRDRDRIRAAIPARRGGEAMTRRLLAHPARCLPALAGAQNWPSFRGSERVRRGAGPPDRDRRGTRRRRRASCGRRRSRGSPSRARSCGAIPCSSPRRSAAIPRRSSATASTGTWNRRAT